MSDLKNVVDALEAVEAKQAALLGADQAKTTNDDKFAAAQKAKATTDDADVMAGEDFNGTLDALGAAVADYVASAKVTR